MWISKIELTRFKSYQHAEFLFPEPERGENIVLIGGLNGFGKTSILEALYLCLYGKDAMSHLARAGLKVDDQRGYPTFLERALNGEAKRDGAETMSVRVQINWSKGKGLDVLRRWHFRSNGTKWHEEEAIVREITRSVPGVPKTDGRNGFQLSDLLGDHFVPAHIAPFFFFDGEEVKKLADQSRIEQVKQGLEGLLGVVLLRTLADRLRNFEGNRRNSIASVDEENIDHLHETLASDEKRLSDLKRELEGAQRDLDDTAAAWKELINRITERGGGGGDIATVKDLLEEREEFRTALKDVQKSLEKVLGDKLPFHLMPSALVEAFKTQLRREKALTSWETECRALQPKREQFEASFLGTHEPEIVPELTPHQVQSIKTRIYQAWASLFHPPPLECAERIIHDYLGDTGRDSALKFFDTIAVSQREIQDLLSQQRDYEERIADLNRKMTRLEGVDKDGSIADLKAQLASLSAEKEKKEADVRATERQIGSLETTVNQTRSRYLQEKKRRDETNPVRQLIDKSERVRQVIEDVVPLLFPLRVEALSAAMTRVYKQLAHKTQVAKIVIENNGATRILSKSGKELDFDRSAGENQIFATALIAGLAEVSGVKAPMVVDTPLGRLDSQHRENIFKFWTSNPGRQVILLSQDEEIDAALFARIQEHVCMTYLLEHKDVGDGVGRTTAIGGAYFGSDS